MADKPKGSRDIVRFEPNERVDLPDMKAMQNNGRSEARMLLHNFLFGHGDMGLPDQATGTSFKPVRDSAVLPYGLDDANTNWSKGGSVSVFALTKPTASTIKISPTWQTDIFTSAFGGALTGVLGGTVLENGEAELGAAVGTEGDDFQILDYNGKPAGTYAVYVTGTFDPGELGTRLFWNAATEQEDTQAMDTRGVAGWNGTTNLLSGGPPSDAAILIGVVVWDGATIPSYSSDQNQIFEGLTSSTNGTGPGGSYAQGWGSDMSIGTNLYGHRSNLRFVNGVSCWQDWAAALRSQLRDIIGDDDGDGIYGWYTQVPRFTGVGGGSGLIGQMCSLMRARNHIEDDSDPHGDTLTQTNLNVRGTLRAETGGGNRISVIELRGDEFTLVGDNSSATHGIEVNSNVQMGVSNTIYGNGSPAFFDTNQGETISDGKNVFWYLGSTAFQPMPSPYATKQSPAGTSDYLIQLYKAADIGFDYWGGSATGGNAWLYVDSNLVAHQARLHCPISRYMPFNSGIGAEGFRITHIYWYLFSHPGHTGGTQTTAAGLAVKRRSFGAPFGGADMGSWTNVKFENYSAGNGGTVGDINIPPGSSPKSPVIITWDLTSEPDADWTVNDYEYELQVRLRGNASSNSPYFMGCTVRGRVGKLAD